ncbi:MAG: hypothetical protein H6623_01380 [Bdellovibrionaceae bacterium]|nr:hypothetical protein [Pseudobdellovibrionaceae bacterium]
MGTLPCQYLAADTCAHTYSELDQTENLKKIQNFLSPQQPIGYVNKTKGSYFFLTAIDTGIKIRFFTSGLWDLYGIEREGDIYFCENEKGLTAIGLDRIQNIFVSENRIEFGERSDKESFQKGVMPEKLAKLNHFNVQPQIAAQPSP